VDGAFALVDVKKKNLYMKIPDGEAPGLRA
jgi:hypothetical protein